MSQYRDLLFKSHDGLNLYARDYPAPANAATVICLPGLTRNSADFDELCSGLAGEYRFLAVDLRGRGRSDADPNPLNYNPATYAQDIVKLMQDVEIASAIFIGTSLGGLVGMTLAAMNPALVQGLVLNDVGPELNPSGITRIRNYVSKSADVTNWEEAVQRTRETQGQALPGLSDVEWQAFTRRLFRPDEQGKPILNYDKDISVLFEAADTDAPPADLWPLFESLKEIPMLVIRGAQSDILSAAVVSRMAAYHPQMSSLEVQDRGHAPLLNEPGIPEAIREFLRDILVK